MDGPQAMIFSVALVGGLLFGLWMLSRMQWDRAARQLGFWNDQNNMSGAINGVAVTVTKRLVGSHRSRSTETVVLLTLTPPLDLGLSASNSRPEEGTQKVDVGDSAFHADFTVYADEAERAKELFTDEIRSSLLEAGKGTDLTLDDESLRMEYHAIPWAGRVVRNVRAAARAISLIQKQREHLPAPADLEGPKAKWAEIAASLGLQFDPAPFRMHGTVGGFQITCAAKRADRNRFTPIVTVRYSTVLGQGLRVVSRGAAGRDSYFTEHLVWVDHPEFNSVFEVGSTEEQATKRLLNREVCDALVAMTAKGIVTLDDASIIYETSVAVEQVPQMIQETMSVATALMSALRRPSTGEDYR